MEPPAQLAPVPELVVEGRRHGFAPGEIAFGAFRTGEFERSWTRGQGASRPAGSGAGVASSGERQRYSFRLLEDGRVRWRVECEAAAARSGVQVAGLEIEPSSRALLDCDLTSAETGERVRLTLGARANRPLEGTVAHETGRVHVEPVRGRLGRLRSDGGARGYELRDGDRVLAAVGTGGAGGVRFGAGLADRERGVAAAVAAALLYYQDLR